MKFIYTSNAATTELLHKSNVVTLSDTRFDQVFYRLEQPTRFNLCIEKPLFVFASTWPQDDKILSLAVDRIIEFGFQIAWCPHDVDQESIDHLRTKLKNKNFGLYSDLQNHQQNFSQDILIIDQIGLLADIYRKSEMAFIGGSFKRKIHSVMEALCAGNIVFFGPFYQNNSEAVEFLTLNLAFQINSEQQFLEVIQRLSQTQRNEMRLRILNLSQRKKGASKKIAEYLLTY
jgi:3-deoxy-D-manno-octulosonic-acid transferase